MMVGVLFSGAKKFQTTLNVTKPALTIGGEGGGAWPGFMLMGSFITKACRKLFEEVSGRKELVMGVVRLLNIQGMYP